jgi:hypothetical protein
MTRKPPDEISSCVPDKMPKKYRWYYEIAEGIW